MIKTIRNTLFELYDEYEDAIGESSRPVRSSSKYDTVFGVNREMEDEGDYAAFLSKKRKVDADKSDLELYLEEKNLDVNEDLDVLLYWKKQSERFRCLSYLARDILTVPVSTVPSESAFSMGKKLINPWRSSLSSRTIEALACHQDWLRAKGFLPGHSSFFGYGGEDAPGEDENDEEDNDETNPAMP